MFRTDVMASCKPYSVLIVCLITVAIATLSPVIATTRADDAHDSAAAADWLDLHYCSSYGCHVLFTSVSDSGGDFVPVCVYVR